jgi:diguanylate cyclase (GGDEF)-like protein/PAS domain S-box-containing protein
MFKTSIKTLLSLMMVFIMIALAIPLTFIVITETTEINSLRQEKIGSAIIPQLQHINILLAQHRGTANRLLNGNQEVLKSLSELEQKIDTAFITVINYCDNQRNNLTTPYEKLLAIQLNWQTLKESYQTLAASDSFKQHKNLITDIMAFQTDIADGTNLSSDNQLSNYYLINNMVKNMPYLMENMGQARGFGSGLAAKHFATESEKIELTKISHSVRLAMQTVSFELEKSFLSLPLFKQALDNKLTNSQQSIELFLSLTEKEIINPPTILLPDNLFYAQASEAINDIMQLYTPVVEKLNTELDRRITDLLIKRYSILVGFIILFIAITGFIYHIMNRINKPLQHAITCFEKISAEQYNHPIIISHQDEIGSLLQALHLMRNRLANNVEQLKTMVNRLTQAQRITQLGDWEWQFEQDYLICSEGIGHIFDINNEESNFVLSYEDFLNYIIISDQHKVRCIVRQSLQEAGSYAVEYRIHSASGAEKIIFQCIESTVNADNKVMRLISTLQDITVQREMESKVRLAAEVFNHIGEAIMVTNQANKIMLVNKAFSDITGYSADEVMGKNPSFLNSRKHNKAFYQAIWQQLNTQGFWRGELWNRRKDKTLYPEALTITTIKNNNKEVVNHIGIFFDITEQKKIHEQISYLAHYDSLTGLINRFTLKNRVDDALLLAKEQNKCLAIFFIDLDGFKAVNDHFGHDKGDDILKIAAQCLKKAVREEDIVARLGGDEFVILLPNIKEKANIIPIVEDIMFALQQTISDANITLSVTPSVGIAIYPDDGLDYEQLITHADTAMYSAKKQGRNQYRFFGSHKSE